MNHKGLSSVVTTVLLVLLVIIAVTFLFIFVVQPILRSGESNSGFGIIAQTASIIPESLQLSPANGAVLVSIKNEGGIQMDGARFTFLNSSGDGHTILVKTELEAFSSAGVEIDLSESGLSGKIVKIIIVPVLLNEAGEIIGEGTPTEHLLNSNQQIELNFEGKSNESEPNDVLSLNECTDLTISGATYTLVSDVSGALADGPEACFVISADNVVLDGQGNSINSPSGVYIRDRLTNVTIKNLVITEGGITAPEITNSYIINNTILNSPFDAITFYSDGSGGDLAVSGNIISGNTIRNASNHGIWIGYGAHSNNVTNNRIESTRNYAAIQLDQSVNNYVYGNYLYYNPIGITTPVLEEGSSDNMIFGNFAQFNNFGFGLSDGDIFYNNYACGNIVADVSCGSGSGQASNNTFNTVQSCGSWVNVSKKSC